MWFPNAWFSKIGLLAVGALLWGGGAQAGVYFLGRENWALEKYRKWTWVGKVLGF